MDKEHTIASETNQGELVPPHDPRFGVVSIHPNRAAGQPCFAGTRVPVKPLWDHLEEGSPLKEFWKVFPESLVSRRLTYWNGRFKISCRDCRARENFA